MALAARPNAGHFALAELGRRVAGFVTVSQNVDGMLLIFGFNRWSTVTLRLGEVETDIDVFLILIK